MSHGGLDDSTYSPSMENGSYYLSKVPGIDAMLIGHSHQAFPDKNSTVTQFNLPGVDKVKGTVNGVPTVMANSQSFIVGTNNYRASGGGNFQGLDGRPGDFHGGAEPGRAI